MRHLSIHVPRANAGRVTQIARRHDAFSPMVIETQSVDGAAWAMIAANVPNDRVGALVSDVAREMPEARMVLTPSGTLPLEAPLDAVHERVTDVARLSTIEFVLGSLQSLGSWWGMLTYAVLSGIVAAYGIVFDASWLLVAAMLIAPMGAPAMVCVVGAAIGDARMVWRGTLRFGVALLVLGAMAAFLGLAYRLDVTTATMEQITNLSAWSVLLSLAGGAAGAQALVRSDRDSLVTGTATGFLVAVALSPPAAVLGLSMALQRWDYVGLMGFLLVLTYVGIIAGGWSSLALLGVGPHEQTAGRASRGARRVMAAGAILATAALVGWQTSQPPRFRKADITHRTVAHVRSAVVGVPGVALVEASTHFTRPDLERVSGEGLLVDVIVERTARDSRSREASEAEVREAVVAALRRNLTGVEPFVRVTVLPPAP